MQRYDVVVVGAGMAGASAAYEMAQERTVLLLERESHPGYHTTGRSAALFSETYGNACIRALTVGSRAFYDGPPPGFTDRPLLSARGVLSLARPDQMGRLQDWAATVADVAPDVHMVSAGDVLTQVPIVRPDYLAGAASEPGARDIDVNALHTGYLRGAKARGVDLVCDAGVQALTRQGDAWLVQTAAGSWEAGLLVDAAGAWADRLAEMAGAARCGLVPKRRTALIVDPPEGMSPKAWPCVIDADETFYFRPDAGRLMASPADETPMEPCDVQPDEMDIAICIDRVQQVANLPVQRIVRSWAGLRSFVADKTPVVGYDPDMPGFFWLAGQGGYGIQTAPAMSRLAASLLARRGVPEDLAALGVREADLAPGRAGARPKP